MSSFSTSSKAVVAAAAAGEAVHHHIRRLSSSPPSSSSESNDWYPFENEAEFNLNIAIALIFLVCFVITAIGINALIKCVYHRPPDHQTSSTVEHKLAQISMGTTQIFTHGLMLAGADHPECTICLSEFVEGEGLRVLPTCKHGFHVKCIESWLLHRNSCPTCRTSCLKTAAEKNSPGDQQQQQQQQQNDVDDIEAANPPVTEMVVQEEQQQQQQIDVVDIETANQQVVQEEQQQQNDVVDIEAANQPVVQEEQQQQNDVDDIEVANPPVTEIVQQQQQRSE